MTIGDLGRNFYAKESQIGKVTRAEASISDLKDLNPGVIIEAVNTTDIEYMY